MLGLDNIEQSQNFCVIIGLGQEQNAENRLLKFHCEL